LQTDLTLDSILAEIRRKRGAYLALGVLVVLAATIWSLLVRPVFRSAALVSVIAEQGRPDLSSGTGALGGIAALAGLPLDSRSHKEEVIATLKARGTAEDFIRQENLAGTLLGATWDARTNTWKRPYSFRPLVLADAVEEWRDHVLHITEDRDTGLLTVAIDWYSAPTAAEWNNRFLRFADSRIREAALREADDGMSYLESQLARAQEVELKRSIAQLLEGQLKTATFAKARSWYAIKVIDPPDVPIRKFKPIRTLVVALSAILAGILILLVASVRLLLRAARVPP
jgi:uncharacterized protein involved in exopolysaccharide biosynthesis